MQKLKNAITINIDDPTRAQIEIIATYYNRKPAELLRLLLLPVLSQQFAIIQRLKHPENAQSLTPAIFNE